jgi:hypothetical protein
MFQSIDTVTIMNLCMYACMYVCMYMYVRMYVCMLNKYR